MSEKQKPQPLSYTEFLRSETMFYIDPVLEATFGDVVDKKVEELQKNLQQISTMEGLREYVRKESNALNNIIALLNVSEEKFKRIVTMLRIERKHIPTGEWNLGKIRQQMMVDNSLMDDICKLLFMGASLEKFKQKIPKSILEDFAVNCSTIGRLGNKDDLRRLVKRGLSGNYNNKLGDSYFSAITKMIISYCKIRGLTWKTKTSIQSNGDQGHVVALVVSDAAIPRVVVDLAYAITTSSSQTKYAKSIEDVYCSIRQSNAGKDECDKCVFVLVVDGAGWVARQSDCHRLYRCADYCINLNNISKVEQILDYYLIGD